MCESLPKASPRIGPSYAKAGRGLYFFSAVLAERERGKGLTGGYGIAPRRCSVLRDGRMTDSGCFSCPFCFTVPYIPCLLKKRKNLPTHTPGCLIV